MLQRRSCQRAGLAGAGARSRSGRDSVVRGAGLVEGLRRDRATGGVGEDVAGPPRRRRRHVAEGRVPSAAEQLARLSGTSISAAKPQIETSKRVKKLPKTADAMRKGKLSPAKAEAIADAANVDPDAEDKLLEGAEKKPLAELREDCLKAKAKDRDKRTRGSGGTGTRGSTRTAKAPGTSTPAGRSTTEPIPAGWQPLIDGQFKLARAEGREEPLDAYAFDALIELAAPLRPRRRPRADASPRPQQTPRSRSRSGRRRSISRSSASTTKRWSAVRSKVKRRARSQGWVRSRSASPASCSARRSSSSSITKGVDVANVTHLGRSPTMAQQVALWWQSHMCTRETCTRTQRLENDHGPEWRNTKHTRVDELDPRLQPRPRPQDQPRLGLRQRQRQPTNGPTRRPPPPQIPTTPAHMTRGTLLRRGRGSPVRRGSAWLPWGSAR